MEGTFSDAALLLIGHGSTVNTDSAAPTYQHAEALARRKLFAEVRAAFWKQEPGIRAVLAGLAAPRVFVVPLFISEGYFSEEMIPLALGLRAAEHETFGRVQRRGQQVIAYCGPVGTHESMTCVILARAREVVEAYPFPRAPRAKETALFIAGHGTDRNESSRRAVERQAGLIRGLNLYGEVHAVFMEEHPRIGDCYALAQARHLVMVPFFMSDGLHSYEDIPVLLGEPERRVRQRLLNSHPTWRNPTERKGKLVWYGRSVGDAPEITEVILERVRQAAAWANEPAAAAISPAR